MAVLLIGAFCVLLVGLWYFAQADLEPGPDEVDVYSHADEDASEERLDDAA